MKVLLAPVNIAGQPIQIVEELRRRGVDASLLQYTTGDGHPFGYRTDRLERLTPDRISAQFRTLRQCLSENFDLYHFWLRSLVYGRHYNDFLGIDLPLIKARDKKIIYRFTGYDLRLKSEDMRKNPYSAYRYGFDIGFDEDMQKRYIAFLREYVDEFIVQDPEMHSFFPSAKVVPRVIDMDKWAFRGIQKKTSPLIVHAPSSTKIKGSEFIAAAVEDLQREGVSFRYMPIVDMPHEEAVRWYQRADIIIDQLHIGWYGVLAIEAMALGKPVIAYIRKGLLDAHENSVPVHNANPETIKAKLKELIKDYDLRCELARAGRDYVERLHGIKVVVPQLIDIYQRVLDAKASRPKGYADIDFIEAQLKAYENDKIHKWARYAKRLAQLPHEQHKLKMLQRFLKRFRWFRLISESRFFAAFKR